MNAQQEPEKTPALNKQQQSIVLISALTATGNLDALRVQLNKGLDAGVTINEIKELLVQLYAYCGFPRSLNGITTFMQVVEERKTKGTQDKTGKPILIDNNVADKYEQGRQVLETLSKTPQKKPAPGFGEFAPRIDAFLKEHLFADVFASDVLSYKQRELITISALASMQGVGSQLQSHLGMGINTGLSKVELEEAFDLIGAHIGKQQEESAKAVLAKVK